MKIIKLIIMFILLPIIVSGQELNSAISLRSPKLEDKKFDYHISFGYQNESFLIDLVYEREDGKYYKADHIWWKMNRYSKLSHLSDEIRNIDIESLLLYIPVSVFSIGIDQTWNDFSDYKILVNAAMKYKFLEVNYSSNFKNREIIISKLRFEKELSDKVGLLILFEYKKFNNDEVWQTKVGIKYEFGKENR